MRFDPLAPFAEVHGAPGVRYSQNGRSFNSLGREVTYRWTTVVDEGEAVERIAVEVVPETEPPPPAPPHDRRSDNSGEMHWTHLKLMLEQFGETYTTKEAALAFLKGKSNVNE